MPHIHTGPGEHDETASAYIVRLDTPEPTLMLHRHRKLGAWLQFGGHVEPHQNPWQAVVDELRQESGYTMSQLNVLQPPHSMRHMSGVAMHPIPMAALTHKFPGLDHYHTDQGYGFTTNQESADTPEDGESDTIECFTLDQLQKLPRNEVPQNVIEIGEFLLTVGIKHWEQIPASKWSQETPSAHFEQL